MACGDGRQVSGIEMITKAIEKGACRPDHSESPPNVPFKTFVSLLKVLQRSFQKIWSAAQWNPEESRMWNYAKDSPFFGGLTIHPDIGSLVKKPKFDCVGLRRSKIDPMEFK